MSWNEIDVARRFVYPTRTRRKFVEPVLSFLMRAVHQRSNDTSVGSLSICIRRQKKNRLSYSKRFYSLNHSNRN